MRRLQPVRHCLAVNFHELYTLNLDHPNWFKWKGELLKITRLIDTLNYKGQFYLQM